MRWPHLALVFVGVLLTLGSGADEISDGALHFLTRPPQTPPHHQRKHLTILTDSLKSGWVKSRQCHENLDPVNAMQVVFSADRVRGLRITRSERIGRAWIEDGNVQLQGIAAGAILCLESENRMLQHDPALNIFTLTSGPYMRRFLDGYFPLRVTFDLDYPEERLRLVEMNPPELRVVAQISPGHIRLPVLFEGRLDISLRFAPVTRAAP